MGVQTIDERTARAGVHQFAFLAALEATARSVLISVYPVLMYRSLGDAKTVSEAYLAIGLTALIDKLPTGLRRMVLILVDLLALALFLYVFWYGIGFANGGASRQAMILGASLRPFYAAIPVAAAVASLQMALVLMRDMGQYNEPSFEEEAV